MVGKLQCTPQVGLPAYAVSGCSGKHIGFKGNFALGENTVHCAMQEVVAGGKGIFYVSDCVLVEFL